MSKTFIGVDVGGHHISMALIQGQKILESTEIQTPPSRSLVDIVGALKQLAGELNSNNLEISGMGIAIPGFFSLDRATIYHSPNFPTWHDVPIQKTLNETFSFPVEVENDANASILGEALLGAGQGHARVLGLTLGTGVGGAWIEDGVVKRGKHGGAGEFGHMVVVPDGKPCGCGSRGCLEQYASAQAFADEDDSSVASWAARAKTCDAQALAKFDDMGRHLGRAIANLGVCFDPDMVILNGKISQSFDLFSESMMSAIHSHLKNHPAKALDVRPGALVDSAAIWGTVEQLKQAQNAS